MINFYVVRNQYGLSVRLKLFKWTFRLLKINNNIHNNEELEKFMIQRSYGINDRASLAKALTLITKRHEVQEYAPGELLIIIPFAKDVEKRLSSKLILNSRPLFVEPTQFKQYLKLKGQWTTL